MSNALLIELATLWSECSLGLGISLTRNLIDAATRNARLSPYSPLLCPNSALTNKNTQIGRKENDSRYLSEPGHVGYAVHTHIVAAMEGMHLGRALDVGILRNERLADMDLRLAPPAAEEFAGALAQSDGRLLDGGRAARLRVRIRTVVIIEGLLVRGLGEVPVAADLAGVDAALAVAEDDRDDDVQEAEDDAEDAGSEHHAPDGETEIANAVDLLVEVAQHIAADHDHGYSQPGKRVRGAQNRPVPGVELLEEPNLGDRQEHSDEEEEDVGDHVEEEELPGDS